MRTHHAHRPAAPTFTSGGDEVRAKCEGRWDIADAMLDHAEDTATYRLARATLAELCAGCRVLDCWERVG